MATTFTPTSATPTSLQDPIRANQHTFRRTLDALAMPGVCQQLNLHPTLRRGDVSDVTRWPATLLLMMVDHEVSLAVTDFADAGMLLDLIQRRTRVSNAATELADIIVTDVAQLSPDLITGLRRGSLHYPDDAATLVVLVDDLTLADASAFTVTLTGPGIRDSIECALPGFTTDLLAARDEANSQYPMGIDILVLDRAGHLLGLPRTTTMTTIETRITPGREV